MTGKMNNQPITQAQIKAELRKLGRKGRFDDIFESLFEQSMRKVPVFTDDQMKTSLEILKKYGKVCI